MRTITNRFRFTLTLFAASLLSTALVQGAVAQDQSDQDDPPTRVARLGYMQGSVSFQPSGESEWVQAAQNRPLTTGDQLWADRDSRAELSLGSAVIEVTAQPHTGCAKFVERFGADAMHFVNSPTGKSLRLRGLNARVVRAGRIRVGDTVGRIQRRAS